MSGGMSEEEAEAVLRGVAKAGLDNARLGEVCTRWGYRHDEAARVLGFDPDVYRARDNDNWPAHLRGRLTEPTTLLRHLDERNAQ